MYKVFIITLMCSSMNLSAQIFSDSMFLFSDPKKELHSKFDWILNSMSNNNIDYRSGALDTQADSIHYSTAFSGQSYLNPDRSYITYEHIGNEKLPVEITYIARLSP